MGISKRAKKVLSMRTNTGAEVSFPEYLCSMAKKLSLEDRLRLLELAAVQLLEYVHDIRFYYPELYRGLQETLWKIEELKKELPVSE